MRVDILLSCGKHIHDCIISFTGDAWAHKTSLTPSHFFYWSACTKPGKWAVICMYLYIRVSILPLSTTFYWLLELFRQCGVFRFNFCCFFPILLQRLRFRKLPLQYSQNWNRTITMWLILHYIDCRFDEVKCAI
jgi:hypothetical protein